MLVAAVVRCPVPGGTVTGFDAAPVKAMPGVVDVVRIPSGVAVLARDTWSAREAADKLQVTWDEGPNASARLGSRCSAAYRAAAAGEGKSIRNDGDAAKALAGAARKVEASYFAPFLAHATMEPQNATAHVTASRCEVWAPTQGPGVAKEIARQITGLGSDQIVDPHHARGRRLRPAPRAGLRGRGHLVRQGRRQAGEGGLVPRGRLPARRLPARGAPRDAGRPGGRREPRRLDPPDRHPVDHEAGGRGFRQCNPAVLGAHRR